MPYCGKATWEMWLCWGFWRYCWEAKSWRQFWCRARNHPNGVWYFNPGGTEPDMRCVDCGENLG